MDHPRETCVRRALVVGEVVQAGEAVVAVPRVLGRVSESHWSAPGAGQRAGGRGGAGTSSGVVVKGSSGTSYRLPASHTLCLVHRDTRDFCLVN